MVSNFAQDKFWVDKPIYDEAERKFNEKIASGLLTPLAGEVAKARQRLTEIKDSFNNETTVSDNIALRELQKKYEDLVGYVDLLKNTVALLEKRLGDVESKINVDQMKNTKSVDINTVKDHKKPDKEDEDDDVDLFGSDSEEDEIADKVRQERLAAYEAKKSKKPALIAKSNIILDVKPWDDETDMKQMEVEVRKIKTDGLLWGAAKLVPLAYGIHKLQISCVVEDEKVSVDWLTEQIEAIEDYVQSVDIAAFNKV